MNAYASNADELNCLRLFREMCERQLQPTMTTYSIMMKSLGGIVVGNHLKSDEKRCKTCEKPRCAAMSGDVANAKSWFEQIEAETEPDLPSYNTVLSALAVAASATQTMEPAFAPRHPRPNI